MAKLVSFCPTCGQQAKEDNHFIDEFFNLRVSVLKCGHKIIEDIQAQKDWEMVKSSQGYTAYPYQGEGYEFAVKSNFRCLIADEPGLGKTIQALLCIKLHIDDLKAILIVVKSSLIAQWFKQTLFWCGAEFLPDIISTSKQRPNTRLNDITIVTYDILSRIEGIERKKEENSMQACRDRHGLDEWDGIPEEYYNEIAWYKNPFVEAGFKTLILDECQQIKNPNSKRAMAVKDIAGQVPHVIALSGTPIKNNGREYFTILNTLDPKNFHSEHEFIMDFLEYEQTQYGLKAGGIRDIEKFDEITKDYIIRRVRADVLPDLPTLNRKFVHCDFASDKIEKEYKDLQDDFEDFFYKNEGKADFYTHILEKINKLRHKAGVNKVPFCVDFTVDFINDTNRKIVIFTHHIDVADMLEANLVREFNKMRQSGSQIGNPVRYMGGMNQSNRDLVLETFEKDPNCRVMIASGLASGEGLNLQFCSDCIVLERQWNPANEEQMEGRFIRIGSTCRNCGARQDSGEQDNPVCTKCGYELKVDAHYILSTGTIDEYFTELVEYKRGVMSQVLDKKDKSGWSENGLMKELALILAQKGGKKWKL